jgi:hypothetical protein
MKKKSVYIAVAAAAILVPLVLLVRTFSASPLTMRYRMVTYYA